MADVGMTRTGIGGRTIRRVRTRRDRRTTCSVPDTATGSSRRSGTVDANGPMSSMIWNGTGAAIRIGAKAHGSRSRTLRATRGTE